MVTIISRLDIALILQVNHIFMKKIICLNKESNNFVIVSFHMLKLPQSLHALHVPSVTTALVSRFKLTGALLTVAVPVHSVTRPP